MTLGIIGYGTMAEAIYTSLKTTPTNCLIYDIDPQKQQQITQTSTQQNATLSDILSQASTILLAIKPQHLPQLRHHLSAKTKAVIVSILAGVQLKTLESYFYPNTAIIRAMPNTPIQVHSGTTICCPNNHCDSLQQQNGYKLFNNASKVFTLSEDSFDTITGLCGSSPAFFYRIIQHMAQSQHKLSTTDAIELIAHSMIGAANMVLHSKKTIDTLIQDVSSPNGTTIAGLNKFDHENIGQRLEKMLQASIARATELGLENKSNP
ncbi:MAG: pyrroline-5-carboxylate reductase [bacterium]